MAYGTSDGFKSTNRSPMMAHKASMERKSSAGGVGLASDPLGQPAEEGGEDPSQVAREHGPAHEVHMMHDHEMGKHSVHSKHPDGHEHHSEHGSAEEAHDHGKMLASQGSEHEDSDGMGQAEYE